MPRRRQAAAAALMLLALPAAHVAAGEAELQARIDTLEAQVRALQAQVEALTGIVAAEAPAAAAPGSPPPSASTDATASLPPAEAATAATSPSTSPARAEVSAGGRVKLDLIANSTSVGGDSGNNRGDVSFAPAAVPVAGNGEDDQLSFTARHSRLWLKAASPTPAGALAAYLELDFFASNTGGNEISVNNYEPRLRHAYATWRGFTGGQAYTTFMLPDAFPEINDDGGPAGLLNVRQALLRYGHRAGDWLLEMALEQPETTLVLGDGTRLAVDDDRVPDLALRLQREGLWGVVSVAAVGRRLRADEPVPGLDDSAWAGGVNLAGRVYTGRRDHLRFSLAWGEGIGRYLSYNAWPDAAVDPGGRLRPVAVVGGFIAWQHWWADAIRSNLSLGAAAQTDSAVLHPSANDWLGSVHANLIWNPTLQASVGLEWLYGYRRLLDGRDGELHRLQMTAIYRF